MTIQIACSVSNLKTLLGKCVSFVRILNRWQSLQSHFYVRIIGLTIFQAFDHRTKSYFTPLHRLLAQTSENFQALWLHLWNKGASNAYSKWGLTLDLYKVSQAAV